MATVTWWALAVLLLAVPPAHAQTGDTWRPVITEASVRFGIPDTWIMAVMHAESGGRTYRTGRPITSRAGAMGLMQLMPGTWGDMRAALDLGADPYDPHDNIVAGTYYLRLMYDRFGYPGLFAAYNAGPARYAGHLNQGLPLPRETVGYLAVTGSVSAPPRQPQSGRRRDLFVIAGRQSVAAASVPRSGHDELFVRLTPPGGSP